MSYTGRRSNYDDSNTEGVATGEDNYSGGYGGGRSKNSSNYDDNEDGYKAKSDDYGSGGGGYGGGRKSDGYSKKSDDYDNEGEGYGRKSDDYSSGYGKKSDDYSGGGYGKTSAEFSTDSEKKSDEFGGYGKKSDDVGGYGTKSDDYSYGDRTKKPEEEDYTQGDGYGGRSKKQEDGDYDRSSGYGVRKDNESMDDSDYTSKMREDVKGRLDDAKASLGSVGGMYEAGARNKTEAGSGGYAIYEDRENHLPPEENEGIKAWIPSYPPALPNTTKESKDEELEDQEQGDKKKRGFFS